MEIMKKEAVRDLLTVVKWVFIVLWTCILVAILIYLVQYIDLVATNPCDICENVTGAVCTRIGEMKELGVIMP